MSVPSASCCYESQAALALFAYITLLHLRKQRGKSSILHAVDGASEVVQAGVWQNGAMKKAGKRKRSGGFKSQNERKHFFFWDRTEEREPVKPLAI